MNDRSPLRFDELSLVKGGLLFRFLVRIGLMRTDLAPVHRRAVLAALLTWLPLLVLSALQGTAFGDAVHLPFLNDLPASARFLLAIPLFLVAEPVIERRVNLIGRHIVRSGMVKEAEVPAYEAMVRRLVRLRDSFSAELVILAAVVFTTAFLRVEFSGSLSSWQYSIGPSGTTRTPAGWWYVLVSIPMFQFLAYRWLWRYFLWCWFLLRISRLDLQLVATHPDGVAGLEFLGMVQSKFGILPFAVSSILSAQMGEEILFAGASLTDYRIIIPSFIILMIVVFLGPLFIFSQKLAEVKRQGLLVYGVLGMEHAKSFDLKWIRGKNPETDSILGSADASSMADFSAMFDVVDEMRVVPLDFKTTFMPVAASAILPFLPLVLTMFPLGDVLKAIWGILF